MRTKLLVIFLAILLIGIYWQWWLSGPRVATDFSLLSKSTLKSFMDLPQTWSVKGTEGLGEYAVFTLWSWPINFLFGIVTNLGLSFVMLERFLIIIPFLLIGTFSVYKLGKQFYLSSTAKFISSLLYLANTYILLVIDGGQLTIALAYAIFPLAYLAIEQSILGDYKKKILAGLLISGIGVFDIRFIYVLFLLSIVRFLYELLFLNFKQWKKWILNWLKLGIISVLIMIGLNFYWIITSFKDPLTNNIFAYLTQTSFTPFISIGHSLFLLSPHWFKNIFGNIAPLRFEFILIPILVFLAPILKPRNRNVGFWLLVALISIFLTKGTSEPLGRFYPWFYYHLPAFSLFRDSSKFFFLIAVSYTILLAITVDEIIKRFRDFPKIKFAITLCLVIYLIFIIKPVWSGGMTGTFSNPPFQKEFSQLESFLQNDKKVSNIFWIPTISPLTSLDVQHPSLEAARLAQKRPFAQTTVGTYELFNYLREAPYMGQLFDIANIGYIVYPLLDNRREKDLDKIKYYYIFLNQLSNLSWLERINNSTIPLLKVKQHQDKLFIVSNVWWVLGSDSIYNEATKSANLSLSKNALIFAEESTGLGSRIDEISNSKITLYHKQPLDLAVSLINKENLIFPAKDLGKDPDSSGWWKRESSDLISWKSFLQFKYGIENQDFDLGGGWAVGEGSLKLRVQSPKIEKEKVLLARVMESSRAGELNFYQGNNLIGKINTLSPQTNVRWFEIGNLLNNKEIIINTIGDINVVNAFAVIPQAKWQEYKARALNYAERIVDFDSKNTEEQSVTINYSQVNPTKYKISISNLKKTALLVFAQNFDSNWKLNGKPSFPVYSLINGFSISSEGQYELSFEPQKYVQVGLIVSIITLIISMTILLV